MGYTMRQFYSDSDTAAGTFVGGPKLDPRAAIKTNMDCPSCGKANPEHARFCVNCGAPLAGPSAGNATTALAETEPVAPFTAAHAAAPRPVEPLISATPATTPLTIEHVTHEFSPGDFLVMVVDDIVDNLVVISLHLQQEGYRVVTAADGEEAIQVAALSQPDLILMDISMPGLDGLAATRQLREHPNLSSIPVVAITAFSTDGFRRAAYDAGLDGYLTKPLDFKRLDDLVRSLLPER